MENTMTPDVRAEFTRIEGMVQELGSMGETKGWRLMWKVITAMLVITQAVLALIVIPFGTWTVKNIAQLKEDQRVIQAWVDLGPRFTSTDAGKLKLETKDELRQEIDAKLNTLLNRIDSARTEISALKDALYEHMIDQRNKP